MNNRDFSHFAKNESLGEKFQIQKLEESDYHLGYLNVLNLLQLSFRLFLYIHYNFLAMY